MNENIKQLAEQAGALPAKQILNVPSDLVLIGEEEIAKFAELIVAECMQIIKVDMYEDAISNMWSKNKLQMIKEHFGVEE
jgi:hypothetical protein